MVGGMQGIPVHRPGIENVHHRSFLSAAVHGAHHHQWGEEVDGHGPAELPGIQIIVAVLTILRGRVHQNVDTADLSRKGVEPFAGPVTVRQIMAADPGPAPQISDFPGQGFGIGGGTMVMDGDITAGGGQSEGYPSADAS